MPSSPSRRRRRGLIAAATLAVACSSATPTSTSCSVPTDEALDPASGLHVLSGDGITFEDLTPTSGPHLSTRGPTGALESTVTAVAQVSLLEQGGVVVSVEASASDLRHQAAVFASDDVLVHPVVGLPDSLVVTAWRSRISCSELDIDYIEWFIADRLGRPDLSHP